LGVLLVVRRGVVVVVVVVVVVDFVVVIGIGREEVGWWMAWRLLLLLIRAGSGSGSRQRWMFVVEASVGVVSSTMVRRWFEARSPPRQTFRLGVDGRRLGRRRLATSAKGGRDAGFRGGRGR
jgi:hypothetical protein